MAERILNAERIEQLITAFGSFDENVSRIEQAFGVRIAARGTELKVTGDEESADRGARALEALMNLAAKDEEIDEQKVRYLIEMVSRGEDGKVEELSRGVVCVTAKGKPIKAKTLGQQRYLKAIQNHTITIGVGPAGTGKTYLAVAEAVTAFRQKKVNRIILTRPAVEAGRTRLTPTSAPSTTPSLICWGRRPSRNTRSGATSRSRPWPICAAGPWTTASSSSTRPRTPPGSR